MFSIPFKPRIPRLCTYTLQTLYNNFVSGIISLLGIAGLAVVAILCYLWQNLAHSEKVLFDSDCYGVVYDVGTKLCSCVSTFLPTESKCGHSYNYRHPRRQRSRRSRTSGSFNSRGHRRADERRNKSGIHNRRGQYRYFRNKYCRADLARERRSNLGHSDEKPSSNDQPPTPTPTSPNLHSTWRYSSCFMFSS